MEARLNLTKVAPKGAYQAMAALQQYIDTCGLERPLLELVKIRASQINGCAYCIDMHTKDARALGETEQRIYLLSAWRESPFYSDRERAALEWAEALTLISEGHVPDDVYARVSKQFSPRAEPQRRRRDDQQLEPSGNPLPVRPRRVPVASETAQGVGLSIRGRWKAARVMSPAAFPEDPRLDLWLDLRETWKILYNRPVRGCGKVVPSQAVRFLDQNGRPY